MLRDQVITVRMTSSEKASIDEQAEICGISTSEYIRRRIHGHVVIPKTPMMDEKAIGILKQEAGLLKQIFKQEIIDPSLTWETISEIKKTIHYIMSK